MSDSLPPSPDGPPPSRPVFTTPGRILILASLALIGAAMYWVAKTDQISQMQKLLAGGGVLLLGCLAIAAGTFFFDGRHRR